MTDTDNDIIKSFNEALNGEGRTVVVMKSPQEAVVRAICGTNCRRAFVFKDPCIDERGRNAPCRAATDWLVMTSIWDAAEAAITAHNLALHEHEDFQECSTCAAKTGTPTLCTGCLHNRALIWRLKSRNGEG